MSMLGTFGDIKSPFGNPDSPGFSADYASVTTGLPLFISNVVRMITIVAGLWMFFNLLGAGLTYLTAAGEQDKVLKAWNMIWQSMMGLVIIVAAFAITGVISQLLFGNPKTILEPVIYGPGTT